MKPEILKALRYWAASYLLVAGFLFYHSKVDLFALLLGGVITLALTLFLAHARAKK